MGRILLVDDERKILEAYIRNLSDEFEIEVAESGTDAIRILSSDKSFSVIVSDYRMPKINGLELLEKVRDLSPGTIQVLLTGQANMDEMITFNSKGKIFRFLTKPCAVEDLVSTIKDAVRQHELVSAGKEFPGEMPE